MFVEFFALATLGVKGLTTSWQKAALAFRMVVI